MDDDRFVGQQVAAFRRLRGLSQQQLADLAGGVSRQYISMIESGRRPVDKRETLYGLCRALQVSVSDLTGQPFEPVDREQVAARAWVPAVEVALMAEGSDHQGPVRSVAELAVEADRALFLRMQGRYADLARLLPGVLSQLHVRSRSDDEETRVVASQALTRAAFAASMGVKDLGFVSLAWVAAQTASAAAARNDQPVDVAAAGWLRSQVLLSATAVQQALTTARRAADEVQAHATGGAALEIYGMLHLQAALTSAAVARRQNPAHSGPAGPAAADPAAHLAEASAAAGRTGEANTFELKFGPANVGVWELGVALEQDEPGRVRELAPTIDTAGMTSPNRLSRYYVEQGRAYARLGEHDQAVAMLLRAEHASPQYVRTRLVVRELLGFMLRDSRRRAVADRLGALARRCGAGPQAG
jgi:transcriptional regulator with XRE-family HTH domain